MFFKNLFRKGKQRDIYLYNTLSRKKELFKPIKSGYVGMYTCGPTVYNFPHLGNMRTYIFEDILKRVFEYNGYKVNHIMNITDVGHLTNDRDMGEDKIEKEAKKEGKTAWQIADFYTGVFKEDLKRLNIINPKTFCKATDNIKEQLDLISKLEKKGFTYKTSDGIYFDTSKVSDYTKLSGQKIEDLKEGARVEINEEKKNPTDFALWKFSPKGSKREMEWPSPYGTGFPGWHIECSAMSMKYLGDHFDIHCGAVDNISIHHTNEIAQSESVTGNKPWVNYWIHGAFLDVAGGSKMSKSEGNFLTLENTFNGLDQPKPLVYRFATFMTHYRKPMEWNDDSWINPSVGLRMLYQRIYSLGKIAGKTNKEWKGKFISAINDDLNMPQAMAVLNEMLKSDISPADKLATVIDFDKVLGLKLNEEIQKDIKIPSDVKKLIDDREKARKEKNWKKSDELRDKIKGLGYEVKDSPTGPEIRKI